MAWNAEESMTMALHRLVSPHRNSLSTHNENRMEKYFRDGVLPSRCLRLTIYSNLKHANRHRLVLVLAD